MLGFFLIWASLVGMYWLGFAVAKYHSRPKKPRLMVFPENLSDEFKAWLADYIAVNMPRPPR